MPQGLADALAARYTRQNAAAWKSQIIQTGHGGDTASNLLNRWYSAVGQYDNVRYVVVFIGVNDIVGGTTLSTWTGYIREIAHRIEMIGAVPIFVSPPPLGPAGNAIMTTARQFKDAERNALLYGWDASAPPVASPPNAMTTTLLPNAPGLANSVTGTSNGIVFEGATANAFQQTLTTQDPTANSTLLLPAHDGVIQSAQFTTVGTVTVANTVTESTIVGTPCTGCSTTTPASQVLGGSHLRVTFSGIFSTTGTPTLGFKVYTGAVVLCTFTPIATASGVTNVLFSGQCDAQFQTTGSSATVVATGELRLFKDSTGTAAPTIIPSSINGATAAVDNTVTRVIDVKATWGTASASNTLTSQMVTAEWVH
jgi:hypothetical protein